MDTAKEKSCSFNSPVGILKIWEEKEKITRLDLVSGKADDTLLLQKHRCPSDLLYEAYCQLNEYFAGKRKSFELPLEAKGTDFQKRVWKELEKIPYGETRSYADIAAGIGNSGAVRAVGQANHRNPIIIFVPCHRVINKSGEMGGFGCGVEVKKYLLELEKNNELMLY